MSQFIITLPGLGEARVNKGKISRISLFGLFPWNKIKNESRTGYIIRMKDGSIYQLVRSPKGSWQEAGESQRAKAMQENKRWAPIDDSPTLKLMREAIDQYENANNNANENK